MEITGSLCEKCGVIHHKHDSCPPDAVLEHFMSAESLKIKVDDDYIMEIVPHLEEEPPEAEPEPVTEWHHPRISGLIGLPDQVLDDIMHGWMQMDTYWEAKYGT